MAESDQLLEGIRQLLQKQSKLLEEREAEMKNLRQTRDRLENEVKTLKRNREEGYQAFSEAYWGPRGRGRKMTAAEKIVVHHYHDTTKH